MTAIITYSEPCWTLVHHDGRPAEAGDSEPHFDFEHQALKAIASYRDEDRPDPTPKRLTGLCSTATTACGYRYDEDGDGVQHWQDAGELLRHLVDSEGWRVGESVMLCPADADCEECNALPPVPAPLEIPGQLDLISGSTAPSSPGGDL